MRKFIGVAVIAVLALGTAACSGSGSSAKDKYEAFTSKYAPVFDDIAEAFGEESGPADSFEDYVASGDPCEDLDSDSAALAVALIGPTLEDHGFSAVEFLKDFRSLSEAVQAEGLCGKAGSGNGATTTTTEPVNTTTLSYCNEVATNIESGLTSLSDGVDLLPYVSAADQAEFLATAKEFVQSSITAVEPCRSIAPTEAAELISQLESLLTAIEGVN